MSSWQTKIENPAWGKIETGPTTWRTDSTTTFKVRYTGQSSTPTAMVTRTVVSPQPKMYNFGAWVNMGRPDAYLTMTVRDAAGAVVASTTVSSAASQPGALTPGRWTPVWVVADFTNIDPRANTAISFSLEPMYDGAKGVATDVAPAIEVADMAIITSDMPGLFGYPDLTNAEFETWSHSALGINRYPTSWIVSNSERVNGVHANDNAVRIPANTIISSNIWMRSREASHLRLMARAEKPTTINVHESPRDTKVIWTHTITPGPWNEVILPAHIGAGMTLSADNDWSLDGLRVIETYNLDSERPTERTLHVTSSEDSGPGSLRDIVDQARTGDCIVFDVNDVTVESAIDLSDKYIKIDGGRSNPSDPYSPLSTTIRQTTPGQSIFVVNPSVDGTLLRFKYLDFVGEGGATNGGAISVGDARTLGTMRIDMEHVGFDGLKAKTAGGALYLGAPNVETNLYRCTFTGCSASNGSAIAFARGASLTVQYSDFVSCSSTGSPGGAVTSTSTTDAPLTISHCDFDHCTASSSTGVGGIAIQSATTPAHINRSQFDYCSGGRASAISVYNTTRSAAVSKVAITNCTAVNNPSTAPVIALGMTSRYAGPEVVLVNNLVTDNGGPGLKVNGGTATGSNNLIQNTDTALDNPIDAGTEPFYLEYNTDGTPKRNEVLRRPYGIREGGAVHDKGLKSFKLPGSDNELITYKGFEGGFLMYTGMYTSLGASEYIGPDGGVDGVVSDAPSVTVWPNPVSTLLNVDGQYNRMWLTDMAGTTVLVANGPSIDVSGIARGMYLASFECNGRIYTQKIIIR